MNRDDAGGTSQRLNDGGAMMRSFDKQAGHRFPLAAHSSEGFSSSNASVAPRGAGERYHARYR